MQNQDKNDDTQTPLQLNFQIWFRSKCDSDLRSSEIEATLHHFRYSCWPAWWWRHLDFYNYCRRRCSDWSLAAWLREYESILWAWMKGGVILEPAVVVVTFWSNDCCRGTKRQVAASWFPSWRKCPPLTGRHKGRHSFGRPVLRCFCDTHSWKLGPGPHSSSSNDSKTTHFSVLSLSI